MEAAGGAQRAGPACGCAASRQLLRGRAGVLDAGLLTVCSSMLTLMPTHNNSQQHHPVPPLPLRWRRLGQHLAVHQAE